jgi:hypothetical protein
VLLKPCEADEPKQGLDVSMPQREQKFRWLPSKRVECLETSAESPRLPEGRSVTVGMVSILDCAPESRCFGCSPQTTP